MRLKNRIVAICVCLVLATVLFGVYTLVIVPLSQKVETTEKNPTALEGGEVLGVNDRVQMFEKLTTRQIAELYVHNSKGEYRIVRTNGTLLLAGHEDLVLNDQRFALMLTNADYPLSIYREKVAEEDFEKYGLADGQSENFFVLTTTAGARHVVYIGDKILSGGGYYARYAGRNVIYVLDTSIESDLLSTAEALVEPLLLTQTKLNTYYLAKTFALYHYGERVVEIEFLNEAERDEYAAMGIHRLTYPAEYTAGENYLGLLQLFTASNYAGTQRSYLGTRMEDFATTVSIDLSEASLAAYGLADPAYRMRAVMAVTDDDGNVTGYADNIVYFSELHPEEDGFYYAFSPYFGVIVKLPQITVDFLTWNIEKWASANIFMLNIVNVATLRFEVGGETVTFALSGEDNDHLAVSEVETGRSHEMKNFRQLWKVLLAVSSGGEADLDEEARAALTASEENLLFTMTVNTRAGHERVYRFYPYSDRRVLYTVNGEGELFISRTILDKVLADVERIQNDLPVDADAGT